MKKPTAKVSPLARARKWIDDNPDAKPEFYCEENVSKNNAAANDILYIIKSEAKTEDELVALIAKVQHYRLSKKL